ncbi:MAG: hypothetical protein AB1487_12160 [Thermodesulfobacteriota bacterium]
MLLAVKKPQRGSFQLAEIYRNWKIPCQVPKHMLEFMTSSELIRELENRIAYQIATVIGIDGVDGSGKTDLAKKIGDVLRIPVFSIDDFLNKQRGSYLDHLRYSDLASEIRKVSGAIIIEGVFLLRIAKQINLEISKLVYVKRKSKSGFYYDEDIFNAEEPVDNYIKRLNQELNQIPDVSFDINDSSNSEDTGTKGLDLFTEQMIRYHAEFKPARIADYVYYRLDT